MMVLTDDDVRAAPPEVVVSAVREALLRFGTGDLVAPARVRAPLGELDYVFTAGAFGDGSSGFRAYRTSSSPDAPVRSAPSPPTFWPGRMPPHLESSGPAPRRGLSCGP